MRVSARLLFPFFIAASAGLLLIEREEIETDGGPSAEPSDHFDRVRSWPDRAFSPEAYAEKGRLAAQISTDRNDPCQFQAEWKQQGPGNIAGRCNVIKASPTDPNLLLAGFATGGIYKSTDGGSNWKFVSGNLPNAFAVSDFAFSPTAPATVWAALGDANISIFPSPNGGILKSTDAGETWQLTSAQPGAVVNAKLFAHPSNAGEVWWASMGSPFKRDENRGVFKSTDGGKTASKSLFASDQAGGIDLVVNPQNPLVMFAATWDRIRSNTESLIGGPGTKIWRTTDGGQNWTKLGGGLPAFTTSRPGLIMSPTNPQKLFAVFADSTAHFLGIWKTTNGGDNWAPINTSGLATAFVDFGWYFGKIRLDPANDERLYVLGLNIYKRSLPDNGFGTDVTVHSDVHDLLFRADGSRLVGCDGGIYRIPAGSATSTRVAGIPTTQFYHIGWSPHLPNDYFGGAQDNGTMRGRAAIFNAWPSVYGGDGFRVAFHPTDSKTYYFETQNGAIAGTSNGGQSWNSGTTALGSGDRTNWDTPFIISPHDPATLYAGTFRLYKNTTGPLLDWQPISDDLTDGNIFGARFHTISAVDESPLEAGRLAVGTSDGNVWVKTPQGAWTNVTAGLPDRYVTQVKWSAVKKDRLFVSVSGYREGETEAKLFRSENLGATWVDLISSNFAYLPVNDFIPLPGSADSVLLVATDFNVYKWTAAGGKPVGKTLFNFPVFDLELDPVNKQLVAGTWGRGIWTYPLDSLFLEEMAERKATVTVKNPLGKEVPGVSISGDFGQNGAKTTDAAGRFTEKTLPCSERTARVSKKTGPLEGVSTFDLVAMSKHVLNVAPFSQAWQFVAADINRNKQVTTFDIVELRKLILGIYTDFPSNASWRFYPKNFAFTLPNPAEESLPDSIRQLLAPSADTTFFEFTGVKIGDVTGDWPPLAPEASDRRPMEIFLRDRGFAAGEVFDVEFSASVAGLVAGQFTLGFDSGFLKIESVEPLLAGMTGDCFGKNRLGEGLLTASFLLDGPFGVSEKICRVRFRAMKNGRLKAAIRLADWPTTSIGFSPEGVENQAVVSFLENPEPGGEKTSWRLSENPIGSGPVLLLAENWEGMPVGQPVEVSVFDAAGRVVFIERRRGFENGRLRFSTEKLPAGSGLFFVKISTGGRVETLRLAKTAT